MAKITWKLNGVDALKEQVAQLSQEKRQELAEHVAATALDIAANAKQNLADNDSVVSGFLVKSIVATGYDLSWTVSVPVDYATDVEYGTAAHDIEPRQEGGTLSFMMDGERVFFRRVHHPGSRPKPFFAPAVEEARRDWLDGLEKIFEI